MIDCLEPAPPREPPDAIYFQCVLTRDGAGLRLKRTTWLPAVYAQVGYELALKGEPGWRVKEVGAMTTLEHLEWLRGADIRGAGRRKTARPWPDSIEGF
jgi:hypothetical protein